MPDVFLSYSREDLATARRFADGLRREGFDVWWDQSLRSGEAFDRVTEEALNGAKAVIVLWSRASVDSRWVRAEATVADRRGTFLPVMIEPCSRPLMFELNQAPDLSRWRGNPHDAAWRSLVEDARRLVKGAANAAPGVVRVAPARRPWLLASLFGLAAIAVLAYLWRDRLVGADAPVTLAVLAFDDLSTAQQDRPLAEGIAEETTNWLVHIPGVRVVARTSAFMFRSDKQDVRRIGRELGATHLLEGSVRRGPDRVRVTVQFINAVEGLHLWSKTFDLMDNDVLKVEDTVSRAVAETLDRQLSAQTERRWQARQSREPEAYGLYLQGRMEQRLRTDAHNLRAMELYRQAIAKDPGFPLAYVSLSEAVMNAVSLNGRSIDAAAGEAAPLLARALELSPDMPEALAAQGQLALLQGRTDDARGLMQRALALNPNDADTQRRMGNLHLQVGDPQPALQHYDIAASLDPLDFLTQVYRCLALQDLARFPAAHQACGRARELDGANYWGPQATAWLAFGEGDLAAALKWINRASQLQPGDEDVRQFRIGILLALQRSAGALREVRELPASVGRSLMEAGILAETGDPSGLSDMLRRIESGQDLDTAQLLALASLQLTAGKPALAEITLERAMRSSAWQPAMLVDAADVRRGHAGAMVVAGVLTAAGKRNAALAALAPLDAELDRMERAGVASQGLYTLRAESRALQGDGDGAMQALRRAHAHGWRLSQAARTDVYLRNLNEREDFRQLLAGIDQQVRAIQIDDAALPP